MIVQQVIHDLIPLLGLLEVRTSWLLGSADFLASWKHGLLGFLEVRPSLHKSHGRGTCQVFIEVRLVHETRQGEPEFYICINEGRRHFVMRITVYAVVIIFKLEWNEFDLKYSQIRLTLAY